MKQRQGWIWSLSGALTLAGSAHAQRAGDNAVTAAEDAFGATLGNETIGLYSSKQVRGFSPVDAGNVRMDGVYFDRQGTVPPAILMRGNVLPGTFGMPRVCPQLVEQQSPVVRCSHTRLKPSVTFRKCVGENRCVVLMAKF